MAAIMIRYPGTVNMSAANAVGPDRLAVTGRTRAPVRKPAPAMASRTHGPRGSARCQRGPTIRAIRLPSPTAAKAASDHTVDTCST